MSKAKKAPTKFDRKIRPALTPEARENQLISLAIDRAEQHLLDGTASQTNPIETYSFPMSGKYATKKYRAYGQHGCRVDRNLGGGPPV